MLNSAVTSMANFSRFITGELLDLNWFDEESEKIKKISVLL